MDERVREMRQKLEKISWEPEQSEKNKQAFDFIVMYSDYLIREAEKSSELQTLIASHAPEGRNYNNAQYVELLQENQRYKEAMEKAIGGCRYTNPEVAGILSGALKGESE